MNKKYVIVATLALSLVALMFAGTISAMFSDTETSENNTFVAGTLDLTVNGENGYNAVAFNINNMRPGNQPTSNWNLKNQGSLPGTVSISSIVVTNLENTLWEPELQAGDTTADIGELGSVVNIRLYVDTDKDGYYSTGDVMIYNGMISALPSNIPIGALASGATTRINAVVDWWGTSSDNLAMSDSCTIDFTFNLVQDPLP